MTVYGCTGHQFLTDSTKTKVALEILQHINQRTKGDLIGVSSLAEGADQVFALAVLAAGGSIDVIIPSADYDKAFPTTKSARTYQHLLELARNTTTLTFDTPSEEAFLEAGGKVVDQSDVLIAVWDGNTAAGKGGTGDIVQYAKEQGKTTHIIWPPGATRTPH